MRTHRARVYVGLLPILLIGAGFSPQAHALSTAFTYQGQLKRSGAAVNSACDFQFGLFDAASGGSAVGTAQTLTSVAVSSGLFTVPLDFGIAAFKGDDRWLELAVRCPAGSGDFAVLSPRQALTPSPYALFSPIEARDANGNVRASVEALVDGEGLMSVKGPSGNNNVLLSSLAGAPDNGFVGVYDATGTIQAAMYVDTDGKGKLFLSGVKNFAVDYPNRPGTKIVYTSLEGPEAAIFHRGVVRLKKGRARIELPGHFTALANPDSITVQLTPTSLDSQGLAVSGIHDGYIDIGELHKGRGTYDVDFIVHALRRGFEDRPVVVTAAQLGTQFGRQDTGRAFEVRGAVHAVPAGGKAE